MTSKKNATKELLADLEAVFKKHNFKSQPNPHVSAAETAEANDCPPGSYPVYTSHVNSAGVTITVRHCKKV